MKQIKNYTKFIFLIAALFSITNCSSIDEKTSNLSTNVAPGFTRIIGEIVSIESNQESHNDLISFNAKVKIKNIVKRGSSVSATVAKGKTISLNFEYSASLGVTLKEGDSFKGDITEKKEIALNKNSKSEIFSIYVFDKL